MTDPSSNGTSLRRIIGLTKTVERQNEIAQRSHYSLGKVLGGEYGPIGSAKTGNRNEVTV